MRSKRHMNVSSSSVLTCVRAHDACIHSNLPLQQTDNIIDFCRFGRKHGRALGKNDLALEQKTSTPIKVAVKRLWIAHRRIDLRDSTCGGGAATSGKRQSQQVRPHCGGVR